MKTKLLFFALLLLTGITHAQVKIGANAKVIGASSNLEVEAANGKKVIVNKADGSVVIETTPASATVSDLLLGVDPTGKVVTVDRTTIISSGSATGSVGVAPFIRVEGNYSSSTARPTSGSPTTGLTTTYSNLMIYNSSTGGISIPSSGYYYYAISATSPTDLGSGATSNDVCIFANVNHSDCARSTRYGTTATIVGFYRFNTGDIFTSGTTTGSNVVTTANYAIRIHLFKISD